LLRDITGAEDIGNHLGETRLRRLGHLERMDEINLVKRVRGERVPGRNEEAYASMMPKIETSGNDTAEWSTPVNWEEDPVIKAERRSGLKCVDSSIEVSSRL